MNLTNQKVMHKAFGEGEVVEHKDGYIFINFGKENKSFKFPDSFELYLKAISPEINLEIEELLSVQKEDKKIKEIENSAKAKIVNQIKKTQAYPRANVAFKCNFCDGGQSKSQIGFNGACSDEIIYNNIVTEHRTWCNSDDCPCLHYHNGEISRKELDDICKRGGFVCYESQMLRDWKALAGIVQHGDNKGKPMRLNQVQLNSLCVLTTRDPNSSEKDRYIFAVFLVDDTYEGDGNDEGYVSTKSVYKIKLSPTEARKMKFWIYHSNDNKPEFTVWSSGLHRYFEDEQAIQILNEIKNLKKGTEDEKLSIEFFDHFCKINSIDVELLKEPSGALMR